MTPREGRSRLARVAFACAPRAAVAPLRGLRSRLQAASACAPGAAQRHRGLALALEVAGRARTEWMGVERDERLRADEDFIGAWKEPPPSPPLKLFADMLWDMKVDCGESGLRSSSSGFSWR